MATPAAEARIGTTIRGKYKVDRVLGEGGMAVVYAVTHRNNKRFAIKMLHPELSIREDVRTRFLKEGLASNTVGHPGALAVVDEDVAEDGAAYLVMELLEGSACDVLHKRCGWTVPLGASLAIAHEALDILAAAHDKSIIHRDLKPANLFVTNDGTLKILDFGIARMRDLQNESATATSTGTMLGTPAYMSPEQAQARWDEVDARSDLWSIGATLQTLITGRIVHEGANPTLLLISAATKPARSFREVWPDAPPALVALIDRALAFEKADRFDSALQMRAAVAEVYEQLAGRPISRAELAELIGAAPPPPPAGEPQKLDVTTELFNAQTELPKLSTVAPVVRSENDSLARRPTTPAPPLYAAPATSEAAAVPATEREPSPRKAGPFVALGALALVVGAAGVYMATRSPAAAVAPAASTPAATAIASAPPAATVDRPSPAKASEVAPEEKSYFVAVEPATAKVEVDGRATPMLDGGVAIMGVLGSAHHVKLLVAGKETVAEVAITGRGPVPEKLRAEGAKPASATTSAVTPPRDPALNGAFEK